MRRAAAIALLVVAACGGSPEVVSTPAASQVALLPVVRDGGAIGDQDAAAVVEHAPDSEQAATPAPEPLDAQDGGAHAGLNLHAQGALTVSDDGLTALGSGTPPAWPRGPSLELGWRRRSPPWPASSG
jgi:hypothetical protein